MHSVPSLRSVTKTTGRNAYRPKAYDGKLTPYRTIPAQATKSLAVAREDALQLITVCVAVLTFKVIQGQ